MMKKSLILLILITFQVSANTGPSEIFLFDGAAHTKDNELTQNVVVEKEDLTFDSSSDVNSYKSNIKEKYDAKKSFENIMKKSNADGSAKYATYSFSTKNTYYHFSFAHLDKKNVGYADKDGTNYESQYYDDNLIRITAKYHLKNDSNKDINNKTVYFSPFSDSNRSNTFATQENKLKNHYYVILNNLTGNINVNLNSEKLNIKGKYIKNIEKVKFDSIDNNSTINKITIKPVYEFNISFKANEEKTLEINYYVPKSYYKLSYYFSSYNYDFAPIFNWKGGSLSELNLNFIYDKGNRFSYCSSYKGYISNGDVFKNENDKLNFFENLKLDTSSGKNIYTMKSTNLKKGDIDGLSFTDYYDTKNIYNFEGMPDSQMTCFKDGITGVEPVGEDKVKVCFGKDVSQQNPGCDKETSKIMSKEEFYQKHAKEF